MNFVTEGYWLQQVFQSDPALASTWLEAQLTKADFMFYGQEETIKAAINSLSVEAREELLDIVPADRIQSDELVAYLVGDNLELFVTLLSSERLRSLHLAPLLGYPEGAWVKKAALALDAGYNVEEVARAVHGMTYSWSGNESAMWGEWVEKFERLCSDEDERIRAVGVTGRELAKERQRKALQRERNEAVFGRRQ